MLYTYKCEKCGWEGDRRVSIANRDEVLCDNRLDESIEDEPRAVCGHKLTREEISLTARMSESWKF